MGGEDAALRRHCGVVGRPDRPGPAQGGPVEQAGGVYPALRGAASAAVAVRGRAGGRAGTAPKARIRPALAIAARLGLPPPEIVYLGDTNTDMQTALAAGMYPVGALWGFRTAAELTAAGARRLIERPPDLLSLW